MAQGRWISVLFKIWLVSDVFFNLVSFVFTKKLKVVKENLKGWNENVSSYIVVSMLRGGSSMVYLRKEYKRTKKYGVTLIKSI